MSKAVMIVSYKGGVGKTTLCAALAYVAAEHGNVVTAIDLDLEFGGLDIALGEENSTAPSALEYFSNRATPEQARIPCRKEGLYLMNAPMTLREEGEGITAEMLREGIARLRQENDLVLFDLPAGGGPLLDRLLESGEIDDVLLISTDAPTSLRSAETCASRLARRSKAQIRLVVNCYRVDSPESNNAGLLDILESVCVPVIGVIPFDPAVSLGLGRGVPATALEDSPAGLAAENVFLRLAQKRVPLLDGVLKKRKRNHLYRKKQKKQENGGTE